MAPHGSTSRPLRRYPKHAIWDVPMWHWCLLLLSAFVPSSFALVLRSHWDGDLVSTWSTRLLALVVQCCVSKRQKGGGRFPIGSWTLRSSTGGVGASLMPHNSRLEALELDLSVAAAGFAPTRGRPRCLSHVRTRLDRDTRHIFSRSARHLPYLPSVQATGEQHVPVEG